MRIKQFDIQNFRKLRNCRLELSEKETVFVGANNSGKTSAIDMLIKFLVKTRRREISTTDFTLSNWHKINGFARSWTEKGSETGTSLAEWRAVSPTLDVWLTVEDSEAYRVGHLIPTLDWAGGLLGVRLCFEPKNIETLKQRFLAAYNETQDVLSQLDKEGEKSGLTLWPKSMRDFLDKSTHLQDNFDIRPYLLDPEKLTNSEVEHLPQLIQPEQAPFDGEPFDGLFRIDLIEAQRGFADANPTTGERGDSVRGNLSQQLRKYYQKHLDPAETPDVEDLKALQSLDSAKTTFDLKLKERLKDAIGELEGIGYPGFTDPKISLTSKINPIDSLDHDTAIQFDVFKQAMEDEIEPLRLPERLNGLGYKNLISMIFTLIGFRDGWMRVGKASNPVRSDVIEPLHLVLIEEPEAHLHAQVQQVFINKAYDVLRGHKNLRRDSRFSTQLVVSTHSSYLAHEVEFSKLRYFKRKPGDADGEIPTASIVNLSETFGNNSSTARYVARYLKTTHCDLFFANAVILVEGAAERMLVPHFIKCRYPKLGRSYISVLEINGAHAHRLKPLLDRLGLHTLIISDLDSKGADKKKALPALGQEQSTDSQTLIEWVPRKSEVDVLVALPEDSKRIGNVRVAYQCAIDVEWGNEGESLSAIPYTFEDALALTNIATFQAIPKTTGMLRKMVDALGQPKLEDVRLALFNALDGEKAKMALDLLFDVETNDLKVPKYIAEGLAWLQEELCDADLDLVAKGSPSGKAEVLADA